MQRRRSRAMSHGNPEGGANEFHQQLNEIIKRWQLNILKFDEHEGTFAETVPAFLGGGVCFTLRKTKNAESYWMMMKPVRLLDISVYWFSGIQVH